MKESFAQINMKKVTVGIVCGTVIVIIAVIVLPRIFKRNPYGDSIQIDNISEAVSGLSQDQIDNATHQLYDMVSLNAGDSKIPTSGAIVRADTVESEYYQEYDLNYRSFIVDIDSIRQSYWIQLEWSDAEGDIPISGYPVLVLCISDPADMHYQDFNCRNNGSSDQTASKSQFTNVDTYLPYIGKLPSGESYTIIYNYLDSSNKESLKISVNNCGDKTIKDSALTATKDYLKSVGFDPKKFTYEIPSIYDKCVIR